MSRAGPPSVPDDDDAGETLHWSDEEDELEAEDGIKPPLPLLREEIAEYNATLRALEYQETTDITVSLASRAHLERLTSQYWDLCVKIDMEKKTGQEEGNENENENDEVSDGAAAMKEVAKKLRTMILRHPNFRSSPLLHRWPLLAADVPKPTWTLGDEVVGVMERQMRSTSDKDNMAELDANLALPATLSCQHALLAILQDLSRRASLDSPVKERPMLLSWRDVLNCVCKRHDVPISVQEATRRRLQQIFGRVDFAVLPSWISIMGMGGQDKASKFIKTEQIAAPTHYHQQMDTQKCMQSSRESIRDLDGKLLCSTMNRKGRYLQPPPRIRLPQPTLSRAQVLKKRRRKMERRKQKNSKNAQPTANAS